MWQLGYNFLTLGFIPHGHCYLWQPELVWLHITSDFLIAFAYYSIPITLVYFVQKRKDLPFTWVFLLFGAFIILCGTTHVMGIWTVWHPNYWASGVLKGITALVSVVTAIALIPLIPKALALPSPAQLEAAYEEIRVLNERLKIENVRMGAELDVTKRLQQMMLPNDSEMDSVEGLDIAGFMEPAEEIGGDYYDVLQYNGNVKIGIGDVTGHGLESGVLMLMTQTAVRTLQESQITDPVRFLDILNRTIYGNIERMKTNKSMTLALLDYSSSGGLSVSGQHEEIIVVRAQGGVEQIDTTDLGFPIGLDEEIADFIAQEKVHLYSGDVAICYTDGITEAEDMNNVQYGLERLCEVLKEQRHLSAAGIREAAIGDRRRHIGEQKVFDDITLLVLKQK